VDPEKKLQKRVIKMSSPATGFRPIGGPRGLRTVSSKGWNCGGKERLTFFRKDEHLKRKSFGKLRRGNGRIKTQSRSGNQTGAQLWGEKPACRKTEVVGS